MSHAPHLHRCKECREPMTVQCVDPICAEGVRWVVLCIHCYELGQANMRQALHELNHGS